MRFLLALPVLLLGLSRPAIAEPLDSRQVPAGAQWLLHLDVDAARQAEPLRQIAERGLQREGAKRHLLKIQEALGLDPTQDLHSITIYGTRYSRGHAVAIVRAGGDRQRLVAYLKQQPDFRSTSRGGHTLYTWTREKGKRAELTVAGCLDRPGMIVFGREEGQVAAALDVLDNKSPALAAESWLSPSDAAAGVVFRARATGLAAADLPLHSPVVRQCERAAVTIGLQHSDVVLDAVLVATSPDVAQQVGDVLKGFLAMAKLQCESEQDPLRIVQAATVTVADRTVTVRWRGAVADVARLIEKVAAKRPKAKRPE